MPPMICNGLSAWAVIVRSWIVVMAFKRGGLLQAAGSCCGEMPHPSHPPVTEKLALGFHLEFCDIRRANLWHVIHWSWD